MLNICYNIKKTTKLQKMKTTTTVDKTLFCATIEINCMKMYLRAKDNMHKVSNYYCDPNIFLGM